MKNAMDILFIVCILLYTGCIIYGYILIKKQVVLKIKNISNNPMPFYGSDCASGLDLCANGDYMLEPNTTTIVKTGLFIELPVGYEGQIRPRSGMAFKTTTIIPNSPGTIDADYRGEVGIIMRNIGYKPFKIVTGDRIAQLVICPITTVKVKKVDELSLTKRNTGGYGSTGK